MEYPQIHIDNSARWRRCQYIDNTYKVKIDDDGEVVWEETAPPSKVNRTTIVSLYDENRCPLPASLWPMDLNRVTAGFTPLHIHPIEASGVWKITDDRASASSTLEKLRQAVRETPQVVPTGDRVPFISRGVDKERSLDILA